MANTSNRYSVAVVIPTLYRSRYLERVLYLLSIQTVAPNEVVVIDQAAADEIDHEMYSSFKGKLPLRVYQLDVRNLSAARNWGVRLSSSEIYISVDDDTEFGEDFIADHLQALDAHGCDCICGGVRFKNSELTDAFRVPTGWEHPEITFMHTPVINYPCQTIGIAGCNFSIRRSAILRIDGWDELIPIYGEDRDFPLRLVKNGGTIFFDPGPLLVHLKAPMGGGRHLDGKKSFVANQFGSLPWPSYVYYYMKHFSKFTLASLLIAVVLRGWPLFARYSFRVFMTTPFRLVRVIRSWNAAGKIFRNRERTLSMPPNSKVDLVLNLIS